MKNPTIEITELEYLIKLPRTDFKLSFISQLFKRIEAEQLYFSYTDLENDDIISRRAYSENSLPFDDLNDK